MKIVVINGRPRSGKDTFVQFCQIHNLWCANISTVDFVKEIAVYCGWNKEKTPKNRKFLSDLKDLLTNWDDVPYRKIEQRIAAYKEKMEQYGIDPEENGIIFIHSREPEEIKRFCDEMGAISLLIVRDEVTNNEQSNHADSEVFNYEYNYTIANNGTLEDLEKRAKEFLDILSNL